MADILIQNALKDLEGTIETSSISTTRTVNIASWMGSTETVQAVIKDEIAANTGPFTAPTNLNTLSDYNLISTCANNFSGSGTTNTASCTTINPWNDGTVLGRAATSSTDVAKCFLAANTRLDIANNGLTSTAQATLRTQIYTEFSKLKDDYEANADANSSVLVGYYNCCDFAGLSGGAISTDILKVCDADWKYGAGPATCTWTVPAGVTRAKFQVWGAGKGSNPGCCCGGAPFGQNGAYAELTIDVTPGEEYVVCAGCSCQRYCCSNTEPGNGCASGVTGPGISCLKADGAYCALHNCGDLNFLRVQSGFAGSACRRFQNPYCTQSGPCWCSNGEYCYDSSCATCGVVPVYPGHCNDGVTGCSCSGDATRNPVEGENLTVRGIHGGGCLDTNNYGYHIRPPLIDADTGDLFSCATGCYCQTFTSSCCCGGCNGKDWDTHPGHGGAGTHTMGGNNQHKGDTGRAGMVQISWK